MSNRRVHEVSSNINGKSSYGSVKADLRRNNLPGILYHGDRRENDWRTAVMAIGAEAYEILTSCAICRSPGYGRKQAGA
jgi:hypothetical protein